MEYPLALKLKEAGFPQGAGHIDLESVRNPDLQELIDAIPNDIKIRRQKNDKPTCVAIAYRTGAPFAVGRGNSPSEAVAYLWLALHA
jgi:hypothetical protein